jgi:ferric iron reductase protein FhuF
MIGGEPAVAALTGALARVTTLVPYLTARVGPDPDPVRRVPATRGAMAADGGWMIGQDLIDEPRWLGEIVGASGAELGTDDPVVAASAFVQGYSYRVLTLTVACLISSRVVPDASASRVTIALSGPWPSLVAFPDPVVLVLDDGTGGADDDRMTMALRFVHERAIDQHLGPLIDAVRVGTDARIGERLLWGNVAAAAATAFRTMQGCLGPSVEPLGEAFFALARPELQGLGSFCVVENGDRRGWFWERTSCCLFDRLPQGIRCADCSLTPATQRRAAYRASLDTS